MKEYTASRIILYYTVGFLLLVISLAMDAREIYISSTIFITIGAIETVAYLSAKENL